MAHDANRQHRTILKAIAHRTMIERGLLPDFQQPELNELANLHGPERRSNDTIRDLRELLWHSIDNHDSLDLDQLTYAESLPHGKVKVPGQDSSIHQWKEGLLQDLKDWMSDRRSKYN